MIEIFKDIEGYEGFYQISNLGRVKALGNGGSNASKEKILKQGKNRKNKYGYLQVKLFKNGNGKKYFIHRLVAQAFIPNPQNLEQINHIDEDKTNNNVINLEWCDHKYNINFGTRTKKTSKQVLCLETGKIYPSTMEIERQLGFSQGNISSACTGRLKQAYGFHWKYVS